MSRYQKLFSFFSIACVLSQQTYAAHESDEQLEQKEKEQPAQQAKVLTLDPNFIQETEEKAKNDQVGVDQYLRVQEAVDEEQEKLAEDPSYVQQYTQEDPVYLQRWVDYIKQREDREQQIYDEHRTIPDQNGPRELTKKEIQVWIKSEEKFEVFFSFDARKKRWQDDQEELRRAQSKRDAIEQLENTLFAYYPLASSALDVPELIDQKAHHAHQFLISRDQLDAADQIFQQTTQLANKSEYASHSLIEICKTSAAAHLAMWHRLFHAVENGIHIPNIHLFLEQVEKTRVSFAALSNVSNEFIDERFGPDINAAHEFSKAIVKMQPNLEMRLAFWYNELSILKNIGLLAPYDIDSKNAKLTLDKLSNRYHQLQSFKKYDGSKTKDNMAWSLVKAGYIGFLQSDDWQADCWQHNWSHPDEPNILIRIKLKLIYDKAGFPHSVCEYTLEWTFKPIFDQYKQPILDCHGRSLTLDEGNAAMKFNGQSFLAHPPRQLYPDQWHEANSLYLNLNRHILKAAPQGVMDQSHYHNIYSTNQMFQNSGVFLKYYKKHLNLRYAQPY
ncbi:MAG: hypothetical protein NTX76_01940 [Alphaproteobacteria bacterium]|nr:hypothetical protein [Alphaproteobacteria bacterium]